MATLTSRLGLHKPAGTDLGSDFPGQAGPDYDAIDAAVGFTVCTSTTRPGSPFTGRQIRESDTGKAYFYSGAAWVQMAVSGADFATTNDIDVAAGKQVNVGASTSTAAFSAQVANTAAFALSVRSGAETQSRLSVFGDGSLNFSGGVAAADARLYRSAAGVLRTDGALVVDGAASLVPAAYACTSTTRPSAPVNGQIIRETDTGMVLVYDGAAWTPVSGGALVGRQQRGTSISVGATLTRIISTIAPVRSGRTYRVFGKCEAVPDIAGPTSQMELRYTTNNTEPTVTSTLFGRSIWDHRQAGLPDTVLCEGIYDATATGTFRAVLCGYRVGGGGNIVFGGLSTYPMTLTVEDMGVTIASSGTVY